ncbi:unnamed protein product [Sphagnum jensenii]|uniref:Condensin-2 complex subunit H2 n=1 Tax=Sphagnum jensenii TaxID=128206 RepID=A0ABP1AIL8_9BRYO
MDAEEREAQFLHLLEPARDLASNWLVDVAQALEGYLAGLPLASLFDEAGNSSLNFAQAALLIQGSSQVYSRKVEYLYALVYQALQSFTTNKQGNQDDETHQGDEANVDEEHDEDQFFGLSDVQEEPNIDIDQDTMVDGSATLVMKQPASLLVDEGDGKDVSGDTADLTKFQIATSMMYKGFLLLDPCDAETVDEYLRSENQHRMPGKGTPQSFQPAYNKNNFEGPGADQGPVSAARTSIFNDPAVGEEDDWHGDIANEGVWEELLAQGELAEDNPEGVRPEGWGGEAAEGTDTAHGNAGGLQEEDNDPWKLLCPHEPGTLSIKPYQKGQPTWKPRIRKKRLPSETEGVVMASKKGTSFPEFSKFLQEQEREQRANRRAHMASDTTTTYEQVNHMFNIASETDDHANGDANDSSFVFEQGRHDDRSFEELCQAHIDKMLENLAESEVRTELATRVSKWRKTIGADLQEEDARPPFNIYTHGEQLLQNLSSSTEEPENNQGHKTFASLVQGQHKSEVCRSLSALLQLVNDANVEIDRGDMPSGSQCFTKDRPFSVKLLSSRRRHENLNYRATSQTVKTLTKKCRPHEVKKTAVQLKPVDFRQLDACNNSPALETVTGVGPASNLRSTHAQSNMSTPMLGSPASLRKSTSKRHPPVPAWNNNPAPETVNGMGPASNLRSTHAQSNTSTPMLALPASVRKSTSKRHPPVLSRIGVMDSENKAPIALAKITPTKLTPSKVTPEGKKRRKRPPLRSIQV